MLLYLTKGSSVRIGELKEGGPNFLLQFPFKVPVLESTGINRKFGHCMISLLDPIAASPDWWEVIRGNSESARMAMSFRPGCHSSDLRVVFLSFLVLLYS